MVGTSSGGGRGGAFFLCLGLALLSLVGLVSLIPREPLHAFLSSPTHFYTEYAHAIAHANSSRSNAPLLRDPTGSDLLAFRNHLEASTSIPMQATHSPTLTFTHIYVLSLPTRLDRRAEINQLARAHGLDVTFVDAAYKNEPWIKWVAERVQEVRQERLQLMAQARKVDAKTIGGLHVGNSWLTQSADTAGKVPFPARPQVAPEYAPDWIAHLHKHVRAGTLSSLVPKDPNLNITAALYDPVESIDGRQVNEGVISTFYGHTKAMRLILENKDESALIIEDDVDFEWDLERLWSRMEWKLKKSGWELALLGHCWGRELIRPEYRHPHIHGSSVPLCLHAYALTHDGAAHLLSLLENPWTAYQTAVDTAVPSFITFGLLKSFSIEPPLVIQRKDGPSDIQSGVGSKWHGLLMDSTVDRIRRAEGLEVLEEEWVDGAPLDPALKWRYGGVKACPTQTRRMIT